MLVSLEIKNFLLIKKISINFINGFNAFTGETGAGKSIIIEGLKLALGGKNQKNLNLKDKEIFVSACNFIGLLSQNKKEWMKFKEKKSEIDVNYIKNKIKQRNIARNDKNFKLSDKIRNELLEKGVQIEDKDGKTSWKFK